MTNTNQLPATIVGKFNLALTQSKFQELQNKADSLVYNEDNLEEISNFLKSLRGVEKAITQTHSEGKAEALRIGREWDSAKRLFIDQVAAIEHKPQAEYSRICREVENRRIAQETERRRKTSIRMGIENSSIKFASDIARCTSAADLTSVERLINLEKTRKDKYEEFYDEAVEKYNELNSLLATQKIQIKELEKIKEEEEKAETDEELLEIQDKKEAIIDKIEEAKIIVQETAINQTENDIEEVEVILPNVKARRSVFTWEVVDKKELIKKKPEWTEIIVKEELVDEYLKAYLKEKKESKQAVEEFTFAGIKFYLKKTY